VSGRLFDVAVDLRADSPAFRRWFGLELDTERGEALYIPRGCAHGFLTLADDTAVYYHMGAEYAPDLACGVRWNDPAFAVAWPFAPLHISPRDAAFPDFAP
jgi:dTDP-4-dehydrorhamnose 3,5-epimerase